MLDMVLKGHDVLKVIRFGSRVYGTANMDSDTDYIVITNDKEHEESISFTDVDFHFYSIDIWNRMCSENNIRCVEAYFSSDEHWLKGEKDKIEIDYDNIRSEFSRIASNSFVKCNKKLTVEKDYNPRIAKKSLFHSLRILSFGIQIMKFGGIYNFRSANVYYDEIMTCENDWDMLKSKYQPIYNKLKSDFRFAHTRRMEIEFVKEYEDVTKENL